MIVRLKPQRLVSTWVLAAIISFFSAMTSLASAQTITVVMQSGLRILDPVLSTAYVTRDHGYMIYDTLFGIDSNFKIQPQMVDKWTVSDDKKTYTFVLRDGLKWHDGAPVKADDCLASIKRWMQPDTVGQVLATLITGMNVIDDKTFSITLEKPTSLLLDGLSKLSSRPAFMMPRRVAETPASQPIKEHIGSGPFKFVGAEYKPGLKAVYEKNKDYLPRNEPQSWTAGGKLVNVDRVQWVSMPDQMTAVNALMNGEIDFIQQMPFDLLPMLEGQDNVKIEVLDKLGNWTYYRFNHLHPPFDNKLIRQAAMYAIGQKDVLKALAGDPKYYETCAAVFGCNTLFASSYGEDIVIPANADKARQLLKEANYDGTPVVVLHPTDIAMLSVQPVVIASELRKAGFNVELKTMDWQTVITQQNNQKPASEGGWDMLATYSTMATSGNPFSNGTVAANGRKAWAGWPDVPEIEALRSKFAFAADMAESKRITDQIQKLVIDEGVVGPLGKFVVPAAYSTKLSDVPHSPITVFWNIKKAD